MSLAIYSIHTSATYGSCFKVHQIAIKPAWLDGDDIVLRLYIQPKASKDQWIGKHGEEIKLAITAPPVDGKANAHLIKYLAKQFKVTKSQIKIEKGEKGRHKQVRIKSPSITPEIILEFIPIK